MMEESVLTKTRRFFKKNILAFRIIFLVFLITVAVYSFFQEDNLLRILTFLAVGTMIASFLSNYIFNYFYGEGYKLGYVINEILFLFLGIPLMIIAIGYLPLSFYIAFLATEGASWIVPMMIVIMVIAQVFSFIYVLRRRGKEKGRTIIQLIKYLFDFKTRAEEQQKYREQGEKIEDFYSRMDQVNKSVKTKMEESKVDFRADERKSS